MQYPPTHKTLRTWTLAGPLATVFALAACGGGGGGGAVAGGSSGGAAQSFSAAPALPDAPATLPVVNSRNVCENVNLRNRTLENLSVPDGQTCVLNPGVRIDGNIEIGTNARLYARDIRVGGNVQGQRAQVVVIEASTVVGGNVQLERGGTVSVLDSNVDDIQLDENSGALDILNNVVRGDLQLFQNSGAARLNNNRVDGNIQVDENTGGAAINGNQANGNLQCKQNRPAPTGAGNTAASKEDQCANL